MTISYSKHTIANSSSLTVSSRNGLTWFKVRRALFWLKEPCRPPEMTEARSRQQQKSYRSLHTSTLVPDSDPITATRPFSNVILGNLDTQTKRCHMTSRHCIMCTLIIIPSLCPHIVLLVQLISKSTIHPWGILISWQIVPCHSGTRSLPLF